MGSNPTNVSLTNTSTILEEFADYLQSSIVAPLPVQEPAAADKEEVPWNVFKFGDQRVAFATVLKKDSTLPGLSLQKELALRSYCFAYLSGTTLASAANDGYFQQLADALLDSFREECVATSCQGSQFAGMNFYIDEKSLTSLVPPSAKWSAVILRQWVQSVAYPNGHFMLRRFRDRVVEGVTARANIKGFSGLFVNAKLLPLRLDMESEFWAPEWSQYIEETRNHDPSSVKIVVKLGMSWASNNETEWVLEQVKNLKGAYHKYMAGMTDERAASSKAKKPRHEVQQDPSPSS